jgi:hypothetical protein
LEKETTLLDVDFALRYLSIVLTGATLFKLIQQRLSRQAPFPAFAAMLAIGLARDLVLLVVPYESHSYTIAWEVSLPPLLLAHLWAALATFGALTSLYQRPGKFATGLLVTSLAITVILCCAAMPFETLLIARAEALLRTLFLLNRWVDSLCAGTLIFAAVFLSTRVKMLPANLLRHTCLLAGYFTAGSLTWLIENLTPLGAAVWVERADFAAVSLLYIGWICLLSRSGERAVYWPKAWHLTQMANSLLRSTAR